MNNKIPFLGIIIAASLTAATPQDDLNKNPNTVYSKPLPPTDRSITEKVQAYLSQNYNLSADARKIKVSTSNGNVTLKGWVANQDELDDIVSQVQQIQGVNNVEARLKIRGD